MNARLSGIPALHVGVTESEAARIVECETAKTERKYWPICAIQISRADDM